MLVNRQRKLKRVQKPQQTPSIRESSESKVLAGDDKSFILKHTITLALEDANFNPLSSTSFAVQLEILVNKPLVTIRIPSLNFILPVDGFVYTAANNLPKNLWPVRPVPEGFQLAIDGTDITLAVYVFADGTLRIKNAGGSAIPAGNYSTNALTFSYLLPYPKVCPPKNFEVSTRSSNVIGTLADAPGTRLW